MTPSAVISGSPAAAAAAAPAAAAAAAAAPTAAEMAQLRQELEETKARAADNQRTAEFWFGKSQAKPAAAAPAATAAAEETDILDLISTKGEKGLLELLKKKGFVSAEEVDQRVNDKASQITGEAQLLKEYPDLADEKSDFFKSTAAFYGQLKQDGVPERAAMRLAAQQAKLAGIESGSIKTPAQKAADAAAEREADRRTRAAAGAGTHGGRTAAEDDDDTPNADEELAIRRLADALEIPIDKATERYKARAKKGVQVAIKLGRG